MGGYLRRSAPVAMCLAVLISLSTVAAQGMAGATTCSTAGAGCEAMAQAHINPGTLSIKAPATLSWTVALDGYNQELGTTMRLTVVDATGSGGGWSAEATSTTFRDASTGATLPPTALTINGSSDSATATTVPADSCTTAAPTCKLPELTDVTYPYTVPAGTTGPTATTFSTAEAGTGMGAIVLDCDAWLHVPADASSGTYTAILDISVVSGP